MDDHVKRAMLAQKQAEYNAYMRSPEWRARRKACLDRAKGKCELCGGKAHHAHHKTYRRFQNEPPEDLQAICRDCHGSFHETMPRRSKERYRKQVKRRREIKADKKKREHRYRRTPDLFKESRTSTDAAPCPKCGYSRRVAGLGTCVRCGSAAKAVSCP